MLAEYLSFILTFIVTAGLSVIGILTSLQLYSVQKKTVFLVLLYQQIFLISFFVYSIWGNIVLREMITDIEINPAILTKLSIFLPVLGLPFLTVSWFMLVKFGFVLNQKRLPDIINLTLLVLIVAITVVFVVLVQKGRITIDGNPDIFIVRLLISANLVVHFVVAGAFFAPNKKSENSVKIRILKYWFTVYFSGVILYSLLLSFFNIFGYLSSCFAILVLFAVSVMVPVLIKLFWKQEDNEEVEEKQKVGVIGFDEFCQSYEISKRESEIVMEICSGKSNKEISEKLFITLQTVKDHTHHIYSKTGVNSRIQLSNLVREKTGKPG